MTTPGTTVLLVDDEPWDLKMMGDGLRGAGFGVLEATSGKDALSIFRADPNRVDMLVTDVALPGLNGCDIAKAMLAEKPDLRILFVSGYAGAEVCKFYGFPVSDVHFLRKPFKAPELCVRVQNLIRAAEPFPQEFQY